MNWSWAKPAEPARLFNSDVIPLQRDCNVSMGNMRWSLTNALMWVDIWLVSSARYTSALGRTSLFIMQSIPWSKVFVQCVERHRVSQEPGKPLCLGYVIPLPSSDLLLHLFPDNSGSWECLWTQHTGAQNISGTKLKLKQNCEFWKVWHKSTEVIPFQSDRRLPVTC